MNLDPWYKVVTLRKEVREGRSFSPDEFALRTRGPLCTLRPANEKGLLAAMLLAVPGESPRHGHVIEVSRAAL